MTLREKQSLFVKNVGLLIAFAYEKGCEFTAGEMLRTQEMQAIYFKTGRSKTMNSRHLVKLAVDFSIFKAGKLLFIDIKTMAQEIESVKELGEYWISLHPDNVWGGDWDRDHTTLDETFKDPYHFEMKP